MAAPYRGQILTKLLMQTSTRSSLPHWTNSVVCCRFNHVFPRKLEKGIYRQEYLEPLKRSEIPLNVEELGERQFQPIKAMESSVSLTATYNPLIQQFINVCTDGGGKATAREIVTQGLEKVKLVQLERYWKSKNEVEKSKIECNPSVIFEKALENTLPVFILMNVIKSGTLYEVPVGARPRQAQYIAMRWIRDSAKNKGDNVPFGESLARELLDAYNNTGKSIKKKMELHQKCEMNKAYAHFRWR